MRLHSDVPDSEQASCLGQGLTALGQDNRRLRMRVAGEPGQTYVVETSDDLTRWIPVATSVISTEGFFELTDLDARTAPHPFYRAILVP